MVNKFEKYFKKILYTHEQIIDGIDKISKEINEYYKNKKDILVVPILDGSIVFAGNIIPKLDFDLTVRATKISSYYNTRKSNEKPKINISIDMSMVKGKRILILEDLIDQGHTLEMFKKYLINLGAKDVKICVLFNKKIKGMNNRKIKPDWSCFYIDDEWVAGFGVDSESKFRNCPFFGIVK